MSRYVYGGPGSGAGDHIVYSAFGQIQSQTNRQYQPLHLHTGRPWEPVSELQDTRARW